MSEQEILNAVQDIFRDNFDDDTLEITRSTCADDIEDWDSLEQINLLTAIEKKFNIKFKLADVRGLKDVGDLLVHGRLLRCSKKGGRMPPCVFSWPPLGGKVFTPSVQPDPAGRRHPSSSRMSAA